MSATLTPLAAARAALLSFVVLAPAVFWRGALEPFEACKAGLLHLTAIVVAGRFACAKVLPGGRSWREPVGAAVLLSFAVAAISAAFSISPRTSLFGAWESHQGLLTLASLLVLFLASRSLFVAAEDLRALAHAVALGVVICATYALAQVMRADPLAWTETSDFKGYTRPIGGMGHPNYLAGLLVMALPLLVWLWRERRRMILLLPVVLACVVIVAALSRAAWLAAALLLPLGLACLPRRWRWALGGSAAVGGVALVVLAWVGLMGPMGERLRNVTESASRVEIWRISADIFLAHPLTGSGTDTYQLAFTRHRTTAYWDLEWGMTPTHAHNDPLHLLATQGIPGGVRYLLLAAAVIVAAWRAWRRGASRGLVLALGGVSLAYHVQNLLGFPVMATAGLHAVALGCLSRLSEGEAEAECRGDSRWTLAVAALGCAVLPLNVLCDSTASAGFWLTAMTAALAALVWRAVPPSRGTEERFFEASRTGRVRIAAIAVGVLLLAWLLVWRPFAAWVAVREGLAALDRAPDRALARFAAATDSAPWLDVPQAHLATALHRVGLMRGDVALLRRAAAAAYQTRQLVPASATYHASHARICLDLVRCGDAPPEVVWRSFDEAIARDPRNPLVRLDAARAALALNRLDLARAHLDAARTLCDLPHLTAERGVLALAEGRLGDSVGLLRESLAGDWRGEVEARGRAHGLLAFAALQSGDVSDALAQSETVLRAYPSPSTFEPATRFVRAAALERLGRREEACEELHRVLTLRPNHAASREALLRLQGR